MDNEAQNATAQAAPASPLPVYQTPLIIRKQDIPFAEKACCKEQRWPKPKPDTQ
jgi:hypothetical protein